MRTGPKILKTSLQVLEVFSLQTYFLFLTIDKMFLFLTTSSFPPSPPFCLVNQRMTKKVVLKEYCAEIEMLKSQLQLTREKNGCVSSPYVCCISLFVAYVLWILWLSLGWHASEGRSISLRRCAINTRTVRFLRRVYVNPEDYYAMEVCHHIFRT
jgi:hypothetical protein